MFDNSSEISCFSFGINLEQVIAPICSIAADIGREISENFKYKDLFEEKFIRETGKRPENLEDADELFLAIANFYSTSIFELGISTKSKTLLEKSLILLIDKQQNRIYFQGKVGPQSTLKSFISAVDVDKNLIKKIKDDKVKKCLSSVDLFDNSVLYSKAVQTKTIGSQKTPFIIPLKYLESSLILFDVIDENDIWINCGQIQKKFGVEFAEEGKDCMFVKNEEDEIIGYKINEWFVSYPKIDLKNYISKDYLTDYIWLLFTEVFNQKQSIPYKETELTKEFIREFKNPELNRILNYLVYNLYVPSQHIEKIPIQFNKFFDEVFLMENLSPYNNSCFFISKSEEKQLALGIYSTEKVGTSYNLLHWIEQSEDEFYSHNATGQVEVKMKSLIKTLKPEVGFYFIRKYFEDVVKQVFINNEIEFISNIILKSNGNTKYEVDFMVKSPKKITFFEAKTKLTKNYIEEYIQKATNLFRDLSKFIPKDILIEFVLISSSSDDLEKDYKYFIDEAETSEGYNTKRNELSTTPYFFKVPLPEVRGKKLLCIAEPEYSKLEAALLEICQK